MESTFKLEILVPSGKVLEQEVTAVTVKTTLGEVGILPQHARYTAILDTGVLAFSAAGQSKSERLVVSGGFLNFTENFLQILADTVDLADKVRGAKYDSERESLGSSLKDADTQSPEWEVNKKKLDRIEAIDLLLAQVDKAGLN